MDLEENKKKINYLTLMVDLQRQDQNHQAYLHVTILSLVVHDTDLIWVSWILILPRSGILINP